MARKKPSGPARWVEPEAEYAQPGGDRTGTAALWRALEGLAGQPAAATHSAELRDAIVASWPARKPMPTFAHRHGGAIVNFELLEPESLDLEVSHLGRLVLRCPSCDQPVLILRG